MLGSPGSIPTSAKMGMSVAPKAWNDSGDSQIWYTVKAPSSPKHEWWIRPAGAAAAGPAAVAVVELVQGHALRMEVDRDRHIRLPRALSFSRPASDIRYRDTVVIIGSM
jgi:hypothetical protein